MPTISLSSLVLTATLAIVVTVPSASISTGVSLLTAVATSTATARGPVPRAGPWTAVRSPPNQLAGGNHLATSSGFPNSPAAIAPPATASTAARPNQVLPFGLASL